MYDLTRRGALTAGAGALAAGLLPGGRARAAIPTANVQPPDVKIESGATLRVLRPTKFVEADETIFRENTAKFTQQTGVQVRVDFAGWEMPVQYPAGVMAEHKATREGASLFDVSHMGQVILRGEGHTADGVLLYLGVRDTGIGLTTEQQSRLIESFQLRVDEAALTGES